MDLYKSGDHQRNCDDDIKEIYVYMDDLLHHQGNIFSRYTLHFCLKGNIKESANG